MLKKPTLIAAAFASLFASNATLAKLSAEEVARLGQDLTPMGAEKAGNADGSIPAWNNGITAAPAGYEVGMHHLDPFSSDKVLFTIDKSNIDKYKASFIFIDV